MTKKRWRQGEFFLKKTENCEFFFTEKECGRNVPDARAEQISSGTGGAAAVPKCVPAPAAFCWLGF
jgi:hypothetical protein